MRPLEKLLAPLLALAVLLAACSAPAPEPEEMGEVFTVRGEVVGTRFEGQALRIRHEEIPGFMEAMTMDFRLKDPGAAEKVEAGDKIRFRYFADGIDSYIDQIEILDPSTSLEFPAEGSGQDHEHEH